jgi:predicted glycosyltransferase involved in capsule biosynthesis
LNKTELMDVSFLIPVMIDSPDRLDNLFTVVRYLNKHFNTKILVYEYGETPSIEIAALPIGVELFFEYGNAAVFNHALTNKKLIEKSGSPFIAIYDTDVVFPITQIMEALELLRNNEADMVYPYDGSFANIDQLAAVLFSKFLTDKFLYNNAEKFPISTCRSFGGCVFLNKEKYIEAGGENLVFKSWGPEDIERYHRMKILGYKIKRIDGLLFHLHHQRSLNSGYVSDESRMAFMEEYINIFNMQKNELHAYISQW